MCPSMFSAGLFTVSKIKKQFECLLVDEWITKHDTCTRWNINQQEEESVICLSGPGRHYVK